MDKFDFELFINNIKNVNASEAAKKDLRKLSDTVKQKTIAAMFSSDPMTKNVILAANMAIIDSLINSEISTLENFQSLGLDLTGLLSDIKREIEKAGDSQGRGVEHW